MSSKRFFTIPLRCLCLVVLLAIGATASGCNLKGGKSYNDGDVRQINAVVYGTIVDVSDVNVTVDPSLVGPVAGGVTGGIVGGVLGGMQPLPVLGGAAVGALVGGVTEVETKKYIASQLTIELESGETIAIVQGNDDYFTRGDPVRVIGMGENQARVQHR